MKTSTTYTNEFTGEVFTDKRKCEQAEVESITVFVNTLIEEAELVKDICNSHDYCKDCPLADDNDDCAVAPFTDHYLDIIRNLQRINN
jgi:hypothetical protein